MKKLRTFFFDFKQIEFLPVLIGAVLLGFAAWQNMYPLVYADTGTYAVTGLDGRVPLDRPLLYGLFLRHTSMRATMWLALFAQTVIVSSVIFAFVKTFFQRFQYHYIYYFVLIALIGCTALSIKTSTLIPDAFTPLPILCFFILLNARIVAPLRLWFISVMILCIAVHTSHLMILAVTFLLFAVSESIKHGVKNLLSQIRRIKFIIPVILISFFITPVINLIYGGSFFWNKSNGIFLMGKFADNGILQAYVADNCDHLSLEICAYKDQIPQDFLWNDSSPLYKMGGWEHPSPEFDKIVHDILTTPKYFVPLCLKTISASAIQFFTFNISVRAENAAMSYDSPPHYALRYVFKHEMNQYLSSNQNVNRLNYEDIDARQIWFIVILSSILILVKISSLRIYTNGLSRVFMLILYYTVSNAIVCGALSIPNPRYQTRVFWLLPMMVLLILISVWANHKKEIIGYFNK